VSDQDFFFDEEEDAPAPAPAPRPESQPVRSSSARPARSAAPAGGASFFEQSVPMAIAALMTVIGLLVGVIIGFVIAPSGTSTVGSPAGGTGSMDVAPGLSQDQLQSGDLPEGHPPIDMGAGSTDTTETESE